MPAVLKDYFIKTMEKNRGGGLCNRVKKIAFFFIPQLLLWIFFNPKNIFYQNDGEKLRWRNVQSCEKDCLFFFSSYSSLYYPENIFYQNDREKSRWQNVQSCEKDWLFSGDRALAAWLEGTNWTREIQTNKINFRTKIRGKFDQIKRTFKT